jgi:glycosyltransferase involved in cell wall biosynthesis
MPKVVHIITRLILGGAQENTLLTVEGFDRKPGWETILVTGPAIGPEGELVARAKRNGVKLVLVDEMRRAINPRLDWASCGALKKILRDEKPDIVHTHSSKAGILGRAAARAAKVPVIVHTIHGMPFHANESRAKNLLYIALERWAAGMSDCIITVCDAMADQAVAAGVAPREKFVTVYSGMEVDAFLDAPRHRDETRKRLGIPADAPVIGKVARLFELKGHEYLIAAAPAVLKRFPNARFLFVGDGILRQALAEQARRLGVLDSIVFAGLVDSAEVPAMVGAMDILAHCSLREGLARVLPQGLLAGVPVISYDVDGAKEVVIPGKTGWLLPPKDVTGLSAAIIEALSNPKEARRLAAAGRDLCKTRFRAETMVEEIEKVYLEMMEKKAAKHA